MVKLGELTNELQFLADELAISAAPADLAGLSMPELRAELEARGIEPATDRAQEKRRRYCRRRQVRHFERRRKNRR